MATVWVSSTTHSAAEAPLWGHGGTIPGYQTYDAVGPDGAAVTIAVTALPQTFVADLHDTAALQEKNQLGLKAVDSLLCNR